MKMPKLQTVLMVTGALLAVNLLLIAGRGSKDNRGRQLPSAIERVIPAPGTLIRLQDDVGADLDDLYTGRLEIDGIVIPDDQTVIVKPLGQVTFRPREGYEIERLAEGRHRATIFYAPQDTSRGEPERSFTWEFLAS